MKRICVALKRIITDPKKIIIYLNRFHLLNFLSDITFHKLMYYSFCGESLNLKCPKGFNEKIHWIMLFDKNPLYTVLVDKLKVREYVEKKIGAKYLIPLIGAYKNVDEINFDKLPRRFVLKCNHNSGSGMCICKDKSKINIENVKKNLKKGLLNNTYNYTREWAYKDVDPFIICEEYIENHQVSKYGNFSLIDYKIYCFNGEPKFLYVSLTKEDKTTLLDFYDLDFNRTEFCRKDHDGLPFVAKKPACFDEMIEISRKLSKNIPFLRVDLYEVNGKIYFSELTLYPGGGYGFFYPKEWELKIGNWLKIDNL